MKFHPADAGDPGRSRRGDASRARTRLAALYLNTRLEIITDSGTLIAEDQPEPMAEPIREFAPTRTTGLVTHSTRSIP
ncbi:hypothetical protein [Kineosporia babensis]|uniref:Uncharacterized protein n=1 Tax=Kineosporia babensis TaxID=499548 RepID=A0A9X1NMW0_9ACTN|nr:hypothetical protein [Kineosporia babensis]MCD5316649.1 hypothetical protein [Kineosporia babensis]